MKVLTNEASRKARMQGAEGSDERVVSLDTSSEEQPRQRSSRDFIEAWRARE